MTIDDIYTAAINGDCEQLRELLEAGELDINQRFDGGVNNGLHTDFTMLFSVLVHMRQHGFNYQVLDILVNYDIDLDAKVILKCDAFTRFIPYLAYAIREWDLPELVQYFMDRGADPNNTQEEYYADGHREYYSLAHLAIVFRQDSNLLNMLLYYGADPNKTSRVYNHEAACAQDLSLAFYSLVDQGSFDKTVALFSYGADPKAQQIVGIGLMPTPNFKQYITFAYPQYLGMLNEAIRTANYNRRMPIHVSRDAFIVKRNRMKLPEVSEPETTASQGNDPLWELRVCAQQLIEYELKWRKRYNDAVRLSNTAPKADDRQRAHDAAALVVNTRNGTLELLEDLDRKYTGGGQSRFWHHFNWLEHPTTFTHELMIWLPFDRITEAPDGVSLSPMCTEQETITRQELQLLLKAEEVSPIYVGDSEPEEVYTMAELCMWWVQDATEVFTTVSKTYDEREIKEAMRSRNEGLDDFERMMNTLQNKGGFTNEELHLGNQMKNSDFFNAQFNREMHLMHYQDKLRNAKTTEVHVKNQRLYYHHYRPVGVILFDQQHRISYVLIYHQSKPIEVYTMDVNKTIHDVTAKMPRSTWQEDRIFGIRDLKYYEIQRPDILGQKPDYLNQEEWYETIYHCCRIQGEFGMNQAISAAYQRAAAVKKDTIHSTMFPW